MKYTERSDILFNAVKLAVHIPFGVPSVQQYANDSFVGKQVTNQKTASFIFKFPGSTQTEIFVSINAGLINYRPTAAQFPS